MAKKTDDSQEPSGYRVAQDPGPDSPPPELRPWETWALERKTPPIQFKAAAMMHGWARGQEMTARTFDAAIVASNTHVMR